MEVMPIDPIKRQLETWLNQHIANMRKQGYKVNRTQIAKIIGVPTSSFSQYTNSKNRKKVPWQFQYKLCSLLGKPMEVLHPEVVSFAQCYDGKD